MLDVGFSELLVFGVISLLVLGPDKLPEAARFAAKWYSKFKRAISNVQNDIDRELRLSEFREQMQNELQRIQELEIKMQAQMHELKQQSITEIDPQPQTTLQNKDRMLSYHYICIDGPLFYCSKIRLRQQQCDEHFNVLSMQSQHQTSKAKLNIASNQKPLSDAISVPPSTSKANSPPALEVAV